MIARLTSASFATSVPSPAAAASVTLRSFAWRAHGFERADQFAPRDAGRTARRRRTQNAAAARPARAAIVERRLQRIDLRDRRRSSPSAIAVLSRNRQAAVDAQFLDLREIVVVAAREMLVAQIDAVESGLRAAHVDPLELREVAALEPSRERAGAKRQSHPGAVLRPGRALSRRRFDCGDMPKSEHARRRTVRCCCSSAPATSVAARWPRSMARACGCTQPASISGVASCGTMALVGQRAEGRRSVRSRGLGLALDRASRASARLDALREAVARRGPTVTHHAWLRLPHRAREVVSYDELTGTWRHPRSVRRRRRTNIARCATCSSRACRACSTR